MIVSSATKKLVLNLRNPGRVTTVIPSAKGFKYKGADLVAVPHGIDEVRVLRNMGFPEAPSPIMHQYSWPGRYKPFHAQRATAAFLTLNPKAFVLNDMGCVDADTEYLTPTGWRRIADYVSGPVAQYVPATGAVEFVEPSEFVKLPCADMIRIKTKYGLDQLLSPEHRMLLHAKGNPAKREVVQAAELYARQGMWLAGERPPKSEVRIGWTQSAIPTTFRPPGGEGLTLSEGDLRLQVAVIADGYFPNTSRGCRVRLLKERKKSRLRALLDRAGVTYQERPCLPAGFTMFSFYAPVSVKEFNEDFWSASVPQLEIIADEVMHWDGCISSDKPSRRFSTSVEASADFIQYALASTGCTARKLTVTRQRRGRTETEYVIQARDNDRPLMLCSQGSTGERYATMTPEPSTDGFKYCFMVPSTFLVFRRNGCIFASGNTGKTLAMLWAWHYLRSIGRANKLLVVSPLSTLERTWADEVFQSFPELTVGVLHGSRERRLRVLADDYDIYVINHDGVGVIEKELIARTEIDSVVIDEIASFRNASTNRWKSLNRVIADRTWVWGASGTPTPNSPTDAWAQVRLISPGRVPRYLRLFKESVMTQLSQFRFLPRPNAMEIVREAMQPAIRFSRDQCVDLPPVMYVPRQVEMTAEQKQAYKEMVGKLKTEFKSQQVTAVNEGVKRLKLFQIACGVVYGVDGSDVVLPVGPRLDVVREVIDQAAGKIIVFVPFKAVLRHVAEELAKDYSVAVISGDVPASQRAAIFQQFQGNHDPRVLVAVPGAMSHGLTLTEANTIVWWGPTDNNETYEQANARVTRPGQRRAQFIVNIESSPVEHIAYARLRSKQSMQGLLLDAVREPDQK